MNLHKMHLQSNNHFLQDDCVCSRNVNVYYIPVCITIIKLLQRNLKVPSAKG